MSERLSFCTLFDSNYLSRGLAMYHSLAEHCQDFHLYVFAFDERAYKVLKGEDLKHMTVIRLEDFEDEDLLRVKQDRSRAEYCWTSTSSTILYVLDQFNESHCTYLDADLLFYSDPSILIEEARNEQKSVLITSHRYTPRYDQSLFRGTYCVQFMYFENNPAGRKVLNWWRERCLEWCFARVEDGKFGDQKYLDDWTSRFDAVHDLKHEGGGLAPWNIQQYERIDASTIKRKGSDKTFPIVFFHFHGLSLFDNGGAVLAPRSYQIAPWVKRAFYLPYIHTLKKINRQLLSKYPGKGFNAESGAGDYWLAMLFKGHFSWLLRNVWFRIFPPRKA